MSSFSRWGVTFQPARMRGPRASLAPDLRRSEAVALGPPIGGNGSPDVGAIANALPVTIDGHLEYGVSVQAGVGYRNDVTNGVPTGRQPQGAYLVTSGTHVDDLCCFDFGNAETTNTDTGNGHMDAINFGTECWFAPCAGSGPWVQADLENGLFMGGNGSDTGNVGNASRFVTAMMNNNGNDRLHDRGRQRASRAA